MHCTEQATAASDNIFGVCFRPLEVARSSDICRYVGIGFDEIRFFAILKNRILKCCKGQKSDKKGLGLEKELGLGWSDGEMNGTGA